MSLLLLFALLLIVIVGLMGLYAIDKIARRLGRIARALERIKECLEFTVFGDDADGVCDASRIVIALEKLAGITPPVPLVPDPLVRSDDSGTME